ncbi:fructose-bisphosphatase class III, partial [Clostridioides difficile]
MHGCVPLNEDGSFMSMNIMGKEYKGKALMDKMESLAREGFFF